MKNEDSILIVKNNVSEFEYAVQDYTHIIISEGVTHIGYKAFGGCKNLKSLKLPSTLLEIDDKAFFDCTNLKKVFIPENVNKIGRGVFLKCVNLQNIRVSKNNKFFISKSGVLYSKDLKVLYCYPSHKIDEHYVIDTHVEEIIGEAFAHVYNLKYISISDKLLHIGEFAFSDCINLKKITIPLSLKSIPNNTYCFLNCDNLEHVICLGKFEINSIGNLYNLKTLFIRENISELESYKEEILKVQTSMKHLILYKNDHFTVENGCLYNKDKTILYRRFPTNSESTYTSPETLIKIGKWAFRDNYELHNIILSDNVRYIDVGAFEFCGIERIQLPKKLEIIREFTFYGCSRLKEIIFNDNLKEMHQCIFKECIGLTEITLPNSIQFIKERIFQLCINLSLINIPKRLYDASQEMCFGVDETKIKINFV